jgi:hypothetical protein
MDKIHLFPNFQVYQLKLLVQITNYKGQIQKLINVQIFRFLNF